MAAAEKLRGANPREMASPSRALDREPQNIKLQMLHEVSIDTKLPQASKVLALYLITNWWSDGDCFRADEAAAADIGMGTSTVQRARKDARFQDYFEVTPGNGRAATIYRPTMAWLSVAKRRLAGGVRTEDRLMPSSTIKLTTPQGASVVNLNTPKTPSAVKSERQGEVFRPAQGGQNVVPNPGDEPREDPDCAAGAAHTFDFDGFLKRFEAAYPRLGDGEATEAALRQAIEDGADPEHILAGARAYADEQKGNTLQYIAFSENWVAKKRWAQFARPGATSGGDPEKIAQQRAKAIREGQEWIGRHLSAAAARGLVARELVTVEQCRAAGVQL